MDLKRMSRASVVAIGIGVCALTGGVGVANAQPQQCPPQAGDCQGGGQQGPPPGQQGGPPGQGDNHNAPPPGQQDGPPGQGGRPGDDHGGPPWNGPGGPGGPPDWHSPDYHGGPGGPEWGPPPPDQAWRGIDEGRRDHQPFNYNGSWVEPIYNQNFNNWGFWFLGIWMPL